MKAFVLDITRADKSAWRRVRIPAELTLGDLHIAIQAVMGWNDALPHRFGGPTKPLAASTSLGAVFTKPDTSVDYDYGGQPLTVTATGVEASSTRSNEDFACLAADAAADVASSTARLRGAFVTISYHADRAPDFTAWNNSEQLALLEQAVGLYLARNTPARPAAQLREHAMLQTRIEARVAGALAPTLARLMSEGLSRAAALDALVTAAADSDGDISEAAAAAKAEHVPVAESIAARIARVNSRERNKRRRKR